MCFKLNVENMELTKKDLEGLEKQLSCPEGKEGIAVSKIMNETNISMTISSLTNLKLAEKDYVLELGHGNCGHLNHVFDYAQDISYFGLEISETMKNEAEKINRTKVLNKKASFYLYDGVSIPFSDHSFDKVVTVNTIYFWSHPKEFIKEIARVLKVNGVFVITFVEQDFMQTLPFVNNRFTLYNKSKILELILDTDLFLVEFIDKVENVKSKTGEMVNRHFVIVKLTRK